MTVTVTNITTKTMTWAKPVFLTLKPGEEVRVRLLPAPLSLPQPHWIPPAVENDASRWQRWWQQRAVLNDPVRQGEHE